MSFAPIEETLVMIILIVATGLDGISTPPYSSFDIPISIHKTNIKNTFLLKNRHTPRDWIWTADMVTSLALFTPRLAEHSAPQDVSAEQRRPANSDKLAYDLGLIDTDLPFDQARARYLINDRVMKYAGDPDFSVKIRQEK